MNTETQIIIGGITGTITLAPDAEQIKAAALEAAAKITQVKTAEELETAVAARRGLNDIDKGVEKSREEHKAPILKVGRELDAMAKDFVAPVVKERDRIDGHINHYQREQKRLADEALAESERKRVAAEKQAAAAQAEVARLQKEADEAKKREDQAIADGIRLAQEAAAANDPATKAAAEELAALAEQQASAARIQQEVAETAALKAEMATETVDLSPTVVAVPVQLKGVSTKTKKDYRVCGKNAFEQKAALLKLATSEGGKWAYLVNIEIRRSDVLSALNEQGIESLAGLEIFSDTKTQIR